MCGVRGVCVARCVWLNLASTDSERLTQQDSRALKIFLFPPLQSWDDRDTLPSSAPPATKPPPASRLCVSGDYKADRKLPTIYPRTAAPAGALGASHPSLWWLDWGRPGPKGVRRAEQHCWRVPRVLHPRPCGEQEGHAESLTTSLVFVVTTTVWRR